MEGEAVALNAPSVKGAAQELLASAWLMKEGWFVFQNISRTGPVDIVAIKVRRGPDGVCSGPNETMLIDVKSSPTVPTDDQIALGIVTMFPSGDGYRFNDGKKAVEAREARAATARAVAKFRKAPPCRQYLEQHGETWRVVVPVPRQMHGVLGTKLKESLHTANLITANELKWPVVFRLQKRIDEHRAAQCGPVFRSYRGVKKRVLRPRAA